ncbi:hypothetical protein CkaCkLH20_11549 [Colletotrichum karsti]|uniref:Uncharacterized protein n=1 Tax=Colletotrichum karsti TaxID=1095194 RepID=A0A9P6HVT0_9PEZI|nr:uncharacterized protein CkaCkLH20_11549 [Colletotrichum karsti]KAF9870877.1 hypothetical protein CkaCkLH20_11549 [Colletotrichum karsti]
MVSLAFNLKFTYWAAPKHVPQHVAALWDLFSLDKNKAQLTDWTLSIPQVYNAANGTGSDQIKLVTFAVRFTHKTVTYDDVKQARTVFENACKTCAAIVWNLPSSHESLPGLLRFDHILRCIFALQNNPTSTSGFWGEWGLISVYHRCTSPDDGSPLAMLDKFMEYQERMPKRNNKIEAGPSKNGLGKIKTLTADAGKNYKLVKKDSSRLIRSQSAVDAQGFNSTVHAAVQRHCDVLDCMEATDAANGRLAMLLGELANMTASFMAIAKDTPKRPTPWWKIFSSGDHLDKASRSMTKLHGRASALETKAKLLHALFTDLDSAVKQHGTCSRRLVLNSHLQAQWRKLVDILEQPDADQSQLDSLFGANIQAMANVNRREDELLQSMRTFKKGERALCTEERWFVKLASQLDGEVRKLSRDYVEAANKFKQAEMRVSGSKKATKGKDMECDNESDCSDETLCEKKQ